jgi:hypothetical protein
MPKNGAKNRLNTRKMITWSEKRGKFKQKGKLLKGNNKVPNFK